MTLLYDDNFNESRKIQKRYFLLSAKGLIPRPFGALKRY